MFGIGDFARHGRVSVRMLRHYDAVGLLRPARVDPVTGYRSYGAAQLARLNRVVALKELGFTLQQVQSILDDTVTAEELHGMLRLRRAQLQTQISDDTARLANVEARLRVIEQEGTMPTQDITIKAIPPMRVAELTATAGGFAPEFVGPVIGPLYDELVRRLEAAGVTPVGPAVAYYQDGADGEVLVHAAMPVPSDTAGGGLDVVDLPEIAKAATIVHHGPMDGVMGSIQTLARWIDANGYRSTGYNRELYLHTGDDPATWVTELQEPVVIGG